MGSEEYMNKKILTKREEEVFSLLVKNKTTKEIAQSLDISEKTVRNHISNAMQKLGVKGRAQAVVELIRLGNITL
ncbi:MAG: response regulator transcription factor [Erysipelotrichaceae bacterium]|nr:response regulator transcription factor [Erysipelotrichaceae bacterium]